MPEPRARRRTVMSLDETARSQIRRWIDTTGLTQTQLATAIGRNQAWMSRYLAGEFDADLTTLEQMAGVFSHTIAELLLVPPQPDEARLILNYRACRPDARQTLLQVSDAMSSRVRARGKSRR
jgi:transcriptional regulator with XRE-family HTH domain